MNSNYTKHWIHKSILLFSVILSSLIPNHCSAQTAFTQGNLVVIRTATVTNNTTASLLEVNKTGVLQTPIQSLDVLPGVNGLAANDSIRVSASATSSLYASNSADGTLFLLTGHRSTVTGSNANTILPRAVITLNNAGTLNVATTYTGTSGNQTRCVTTLNNTNFYIADQGGMFTNGTSAASPVVNVRGSKAFGDTVYLGFNSTSTPQVATLSAITGGTVNGLPGLINNNTFQDFYMISSGVNGTAFDILYITSNTSATAGSISKFSLVSGSWVANGSYTTTFGGFGIAAERVCGGAHLFVTSGNGATAANSLYRLFDESGYNQPIAITTANNIILHSTPAGTTLKGVAFAPRPNCSPSTAATMVAGGFTTICQGNTTTLQVNITGGTPPYTVVYSDGTNCTTVNGYLSGSSIQVTPSTSTTYSLLSVTSANGCIGTGNSGQVAITVNPTASTSVSMAASPMGTICAGTSVTFTATASGTGATPTYTFFVNNVQVQTGASNTYTSSSLSNSDVVYVSMTSSDNCANPLTASSSTVVMSVNPIPTVSISPVLTTICQGTNTSLTASGASTYTWMPGSLSGGVVSVSPLSLGVTTYTVTGTSLGCSSTATAQIIVNPTPSMTLSTTPPLCNGGTGSVTANVTGGTSPYNYFINNGPIVQTNVFGGLVSTTYTVVAADNNGCSVSSTVLLAQPTPIVPNSISTPILCNGANSQVTVSATGGTPPYTGTGSFFAPAGPYSYLITDNNGCTTNATGTISQPTALIVTATPGNIACNGGTTSVVVAASGGTGTITGIGTFNNVPSGPYSYTVQDGNGCLATANGNITQPAPVTVTAAHPPIQCFGNATNVAVSASGGTAPYTGTGTFVVGAGTYTYNVTDNNGCSGTLNNYVVTEPTQLVATSTPQTIACGATVVNVQVSATGGTPYSFGYIGTGLLPTAIGNYGFTVMDSLGCAAFTSGFTTAPNTVQVTATASSTLNCGGNGVFELVASGTGINYNWQPGNLNGANQVVVVPGNQTYTVTATAGGLCSATSVVNINLTTPSGNVAQSIANNSIPGLTSQTATHLDGLNLTYYNGLCDVIATIQDGVGGNALGSTTVYLQVENTIPSYNGQPYVARHYTITPTNNGPAMVTLYFSQSDFDNYNNANGNFSDLPTTGSNADPNIANIRITKVDGALGVGTPTVITPTMNWNGNYWEASFAVSGFSSFFMHSANPGNAPLPVSISSFNGRQLAHSDIIQWITAQETNNDRFELQYSNDAKEFKTIATIASKAMHGNSNEPLSYEYQNENVREGHNYYRLTQVDIDGSITTHSHVINLIRTTQGSIVKMYPNPTHHTITVELHAATSQQTLVSVSDMSGRVVKTVQANTVAGNNKLELDLSTMAAGVYTIQVYENSQRTVVEKIEKRN